MSNNNGKTYKMGLFGLTATAVGTTVGAGVVTLVGRAVSVTGGSTWLAYLVAILWGAVTVLPFAFVSSALRVEGGNYSTVLNLGGRRLAGIYVCSSILMALNWATFGVGLSDYLSAYMPSINKTVIAATCILLFYGLNLLGISAFEKVQSIMTVMLVLMLVFFGLYGLPRIHTEIFDFHNPTCFSGGMEGFCEAAGMFLYSTVTYQILLNFSGRAKKPKKLIPLAMLLCMLIIIVIYGLVAITATGVLPLEQAANKTLLDTAQAMWPSILVVLFVIFGPVMALATTLNGNIVSFSIPIEAAARDGWFPKVFAKANRYGAPYVVYTVGALIALLPVIFGMDFNTIIKNMVVVFNMNGLFIFISACYLPKKYPEAWKKASMHLPKPAFVMVMAVSFVALIGALYIQFRGLQLAGVITTVVAYTIIIVYALYREKKGHIHIQKDALTVVEAED